MGDTTLHQTEALTQARIDIARLEEIVEAQGRTITDLRDAVDELRDAVLAVQGTLAEARGGWRTLMLIGGAGTAFGAGVAWLLDHLPRWVR